jgi:hypothetical protein
VLQHLKDGGAEVASPLKALELTIAAAQYQYLRGQGFDAEDEALADSATSDPLRASSLRPSASSKRSAKRSKELLSLALGRKVARVGVVGAGLMASQLALLLLRNLKCPVVMTDIDQERADKGVAWVKNELAKLVEKKRMSAESAGRTRYL